MTHRVTTGRHCQADELRKTGEAPRFIPNITADKAARIHAEHWLIVQKGIDLIGIGLGPQAAAFEEPADTAADSPCDSIHSSIRGRRRRVEAEAAAIVLGINVVECQHVEMDVEVQ